MEIFKTELEGVILIQPDVFYDGRGYFYESWQNFKYNTFLSSLFENFKQDNESCSKKGVFRGMHWQIPPFDQAKLVRCVKGKVLDIVVNIMKNSPDFGKMIAVELSEYNKHQLFIPRGYAHGFISLEDGTILNYKADNYYEKTAERSFNFDSLDLTKFDEVQHLEIEMSEKDKNSPMLGEIEEKDLFIVFNPTATNSDEEKEDEKEEEEIVVDETPIPFEEIIPFDDVEENKEEVEEHIESPNITVQENPDGSKTVTMTIEDFLKNYNNK